MYHYTECGLDSVFLVDGYRLESDPRYGDILTVENVLALHLEIGRYLVQRDRTLNGAEFRFLRSELDLSQRAMARVLGTNEQSIAKWEKERSKPVANKAAERLLRLFFASRASGGESRLATLLGRMADLDNGHADAEFRLSRSGDGWLASAA